MIRKVITEHSTYVFDLDESEFKRVPNHEDAAALRKDDTWIPYITIHGGVDVGKPMVIISSSINGDPDIYTYRTTTPVVEIKDIDI